MTLTYPKDINAMFVPRGTLKDFEPDVSDGVYTKTNKTLARKYEGLILRKQGFIISLITKKNERNATQKRLGGIDENKSKRTS